MIRGEGPTDTSLSGLQSASRADDVGVETPVPPARVAELFSAIDKASRSQRLYQPNNPVYRGFISAAQKHITKLWDDVSSFTVSVEEQGFRWYGRLFGMGEGRDTLPFLFYKDGIRFITLLPGFEDEFERFLDAVNRARAHAQGGDEDIVTLLWQEEFTSFQYSYIDALAESLNVPGSAIPKLQGVELTLVRQEAAASTTAAGMQPTSSPDDAESGFKSRHEFDETLYFLDDQELAALRREVELEWERDTQGAVVDALFDRLEDGREEWSAEILRNLRQLVPVFLGSGDLGVAARVLMDLAGVMERGLLQDESLDEARAFFEELSDPAVLNQLLRSLADGSIDPDSTELGVFLRHLGPKAMPVLLGAVERVEAGPLQERIRSALAGLGAAHPRQLMALLRHEDVDIVRGAAGLCGRLALIPAAAAITDLLDRGDEATRRVAVEALVEIRNSPAMEAVQRALTDEGREVRIAAARGLASLNYAPARPRLEALLDSVRVRDADLTEKIAFFGACGAVANADTVGMLDRMLNGRRLFGKESPEMRACAAMTLGRIGTPAARASLQRAREVNNPMVRSAVLKALRQETA
jgi:HEAT repeat protein